MLAEIKRQMQHGGVIDTPEERDRFFRYLDVLGPRFEPLVVQTVDDIYNGVPEDRIVQRYDKIVALLKARKIEVVIQSTLECTGAVCGEKLARVRSLNARLRALAKKRRVRFVDINGPLSDGGGLKTAFSRDGVQLNGDGYARWYTLLKPHVRS